MEVSVDFKRATLGRTGLPVCRLGVSGGYGAPISAFEMALERGVNYFYHGSRRAPGMNAAIKNIVAKGRREDLLVVAQNYWRAFEWPFRRSFDSFLKKTGLEYVDILLLGWHNAAPAKKFLDICRALKTKGLIRFLAISGHNRPAFPEFARSGTYDVCHVRYNAVHTGAEKEVFPLLSAESRPGIVIYTATSWGQLLKPRNIPAGEQLPRGSDCYRFVMTNPAVDVCMTGPRSLEHMKEALESLDRGPMSEEELAWMRRVGSHIHG